MIGLIALGAFVRDFRGRARVEAPGQTPVDQDAV